MKFAEQRKCRRCRQNPAELLKAGANGTSIRLCLGCMEMFTKAEELAAAVEWLEKSPDVPDWCVPGVMFAAKIFRARIQVLMTGQGGVTQEQVAEWGKEVRPGRIIVVSEVGHG